MTVDMNAPAAESPLRCAVSIATHNRRAELEMTCRALDALEPAPDEVWVVADGCTDDTVDFIRRNYPRYHLIEHASSQGHVRSRDEIVRKTECALILVLDDDSYPVEKDFIARLRQLFVWRPKLAVASIEQWTDEFPDTIDRIDFGPPTFRASYSNASAVHRRAVYLELGGYDLDFYHAYDEIDYALRVVAAGYEIYKPTNLTIRHHFSSVNRDEVRMHQLHARYEQASLWRHCPMPQAIAVSLFRAVRQGQYALKRGWHWLEREPEWWKIALREIPNHWRVRRPLDWGAYRSWMKLMRHPISKEADWRRFQSRFISHGSGEVSEMDQPRIAMAATNPCHLYPMARVLAREGVLSAYYSGYPKWKLPGSDAVPVQTHSLRTLAVYGALKFLPQVLRPKSEKLFQWQDVAFDRWVSTQLNATDFVHGLPGQCLEIFRQAQDKGIRTVLNHATGPVKNQVQVLKAEYERAGLDLGELSYLDETLRKRHREEMELADFHCVASTIVRDQLVRDEKIDVNKIWVIPYGADQDVFYPRRGEGPKDFRIIYAGQYTLRKGLRFLMEALAEVAEPGWRLDCYGPQWDGATPRLETDGIKCPVEFHQAIPSPQLAEVFRNSSLLVLPSLEEGFGLVVVQALNCGIPCVVSDCVGAADLIEQRVNGSRFPSGNSHALAEELRWWSGQRKSPGVFYPWEEPAEKLIRISREILES
jgi:GT2 family glycosyltransferase